METRRLPLLAAAEPVGDPLLLWRAADRLGIGAAAATSATEADLVDFGARVRFRHPLVRSAIYWSAPAEARQEVHRVLAQVTDPELDADRRAWHLAMAASPVRAVPWSTSPTPRARHRRRHTRPGRRISSWTAWRRPSPGDTPRDYRFCAMPSTP